MAYVIEILNTAGSKVAQIDERECDVIISREINKEWSIQLSYPVPVTGEDKSDYLTAFKYRLKLYETDSGDYQTFTITKDEQIHDKKDTLIIRVYGEHEAVVDLNSAIIAETIDYVNVLPSVVMTKILSYVSGWSSGTVSPTVPVSVYLSYETAMSALQKLVALTGGEYDVDEANSEIDLLTALGADNNVQVRYEKNLESIKRTRFARNVVNKMYGVGGGQPPATISGALHVANAYNDVSGVLTVDDAKTVPENDSWNTNYEVYFVTGAEAGNAYTITDSVAAAANDTLTIDAGLTIAAGDRFRIRTTAHADVDFIRAATSIASYGEIQGAISNRGLADAVNWVETSDLSGTYTGGLCADWTKEGLPTLAENTTATYVIYGSKSQKSESASDGDGISQAVAFTSGLYFRAVAWVYVSSGTVKLQVSDGTTTWYVETAETGWQQFSIYELAAGATLTLKVIQSGAPAATFYVDAVMVTESETAYSFTKNSQQKDLWNEAYDEIVRTKDPKVEYDVSFVDLYKMNPELYNLDEISLGDTVTVYDNDLGISDLTARVKRMKWNPFQPELTRHIVNNE